MTLNNQSGKYYDQQPGNLLVGGIYPSQEFHDNNINKTMHPSYKKLEIVKENSEFYSNLLLDQMGMALYPGVNYEKITNKVEISELENLSIISSEQICTVSQNIQKQIIKFIKTPDAGSDFEKIIQQLPLELSDEKLFGLLFSKGYAIKTKITPDKSEIISFAAYQKHPEQNLIKVFKFHTDEVYRGDKLSYEILNGLLDDYKEFNLQIGKGPAEQDNGKQPHGASKRMVELHKDKGYNVDFDRFIIQNNNI